MKRLPFRKDATVLCEDVVGAEVLREISSSGIGDFSSVGAGVFVCSRVCVMKLSLPSE